jgi:hypothetical protein
MVATRRKTRSAPEPEPAPAPVAEELSPAPAPVAEELSPEEDSESEAEEEEQVEEQQNDSEEQESSEDSEEEEEQDEEEEEEGSDEEEEEDNEQEKRSTANKLEIIPVASATGEQCTFDLRNLLAMNSHQVSTAALYSTKTKKASSEEKLTIAPTGLGVSINEDYILEKATDGCAQLLGALWQMPIERSDAGPMVFLPSWDEIKIPRALVSYRRRCHPRLFVRYSSVPTIVIGRPFIISTDRRSSHFLPYHFSLTTFACSLLHPRNKRQSGRSLPKKRASR